jgi:excinuclease ABC subunit C
MGIKDFVKVSKLKKLEFIPYDFAAEFLEIAENGILKVNKYGGGIYRMYDADNQIIYVGKSNDINRRLHEHLGKRSNTAYFIDQVKKIEFFVENDPALQTMLEGIFIAYHEPKFNDEIKDRSKLK